MELLGFTPDYDPTTPGALLDVTNIVPTNRGIEPAKAMQSAGLPAMVAASIGAALIYRVDGSTRLFSGTSSNLYESSAGAWVSRSRVAPYTTASDGRWRFAQFGDATIATNGADVLQVSTAVGSSFADIATAPKAKAVEVVAGFVMALGYNDGVNNFPDGWFSSGLLDHTNWTPSVASQSANGRLLQTYGEIRGGKRLGESIVVYKEKSMFLGSYVGPPVIWQWSVISDSIGAFSHEAIVPVDYGHYFVGPNGFYYFDGTRPTPIGEKEVRDWFFANSHTAYRYRTIGGYNPGKKLIYWHFASNGSNGALDTIIAYHIPTGKWGKVIQTIEARVDFSVSGPTYDGVGSIYSTYDSIPTNIPYDNPLWMAGVAQSGYIDSTHTLVIPGSTALGSSMVTSFTGDDAQFSTLKRIVTRFSRNSASISFLTIGTQTLEGVASAFHGGNIISGKGDVLQSARWHQMQLDLVGDYEILSYDLEMQQGGRR